MSRPTDDKRMIPPFFRPNKKAFSLLEVLVSMFILTIIIWISFTFIRAFSLGWSKARSSTEMFREARTAFEIVTRKLSQATLNTYWDYQLDERGKPSRYVRASDLHFLCGGSLVPGSSGHAIFFQAPESFTMETAHQGMNGLLNAVGFYVVYGRKDANAPSLITTRKGYKHQWRYLLEEVVQPTENLLIYNTKNTQLWYTMAQENGFVRPIAENIIVLVIWPRLSSTADPDGLTLAPNYQYDSRKEADKIPQPPQANQLPPTVQVTMLAVDEDSMIRLMGNQEPSTPPPLIHNLLEGRFTRASMYHNDLQAIEDGLKKLKIPYHLFSAVVPLRGSKWSN